MKRDGEKVFALRVTASLACILIGMILVGQSLAALAYSNIIRADRAVLAGLSFLAIAVPQLFALARRL